MGLDMYLTGQRFIWYNEKELSDKIKEILKTPFKVKGVEIELGYWRKANQIHKWFVDNCQNGVDNCQNKNISKYQLQALLNVVNKVLTDHSLAQELLPNQIGFFFGICGKARIKTW